MTAESWGRIENLLLEASALERKLRTGFLDEACKGEPGIRAEVESLLDADQESVRFLDRPPSRLAADVLQPKLELPEFVGPYRILGLLGEGGMGIVCKAEQKSPQRIVALKVIRAVMMTGSILRRFELEAQALGRLQHPGIAQVYDAGTAGRQPYFAMELIHGRPLLAYVMERSLSTRERLELMVKVCEAVNHAHQRGILHRDLKPGNILVDDSGQSKILDFGVARILDSDSQVTRHTELGQLIGTVDYMSPEQTLGDPLNIDVRSDVYSLGVILYELLSGKLPYEAKGRPITELILTIQKTDPAPLSATDRRYRGDLETIVNKALEKQKERRYASAADLSGDIRRHLSDEPILAMPASAGYRASKFYRRYRTGVIAAGVFGLVVIGFGVAMAILATRNARERDIARTERARADAVVSFLQRDVLAQANSDAQSGPIRDPDLKVRDALDRAAARIDGKFEKQPLVEASIRQTIGETYTIVGVLPSAQHHLERALEIRRRLLGNEHPDTIASMVSLGSIYRSEGIAQSEFLLREAAQNGTKVLGEEHPVVLEAMAALGKVYFEGARPGEAELVLRKVIEIRRRAPGPDDAQTIAAMNDLANVFAMEGKFGEAERLYLEVIEAESKQPHPSPDPVSNLGNYYVKRGRFKEAEVYLQKAMDASRNMNEERPFRLYMLESLGALYLSTGRFREAEANFQHVWDVRRRVIGDQNRNTLSDVYFLGDLYCTEGKWKQGEKMLLQAADAQQHLLGDGHWFTQRSMLSVGLCYLRQNRLPEAEAWTGKLAQIQRRQFGTASYHTQETLAVLGDIQLRRGMTSETEATLRDACAVPLAEAPNDWEGFYCESLRGSSLAAAKSYASAEPLLLSGYRGLLANRSHIPAGRWVHLANARAALARMYENWGKPEVAVNWK